MSAATASAASAVTSVGAGLPRNNGVGLAASGWHEGDFIPAPPDQKSTLTPEARSKTTGATTLASTDRRYVINTPGSWATLRSYAQSFMIGNAANGWIFDRTYEGGQSYYYGYTYNNFNACGWINAANIDPSTATAQHNCANAPTTIPPRSFAAAVNSNSSDSGTGSKLISDAVVYRNVSPQGTTSPSDPLIVLKKDTLVSWRYVTADGLYVAFSDGADLGLDAWGFTARSNLKADLCSGWSDQREKTVQQEWPATCAN